MRLLWMWKKHVASTKTEKHICLNNKDILFPVNKIKKHISHTHSITSFPELGSVESDAPGSWSMSSIEILTELIHLLQGLNGIDELRRNRSKSTKFTRNLWKPPMALRLKPSGDLGPSRDARLGRKKHLDSLVRMILNWTHFNSVNQKIVRYRKS